MKLKKKAKYAILSYILLMGIFVVPIIQQQGLAVEDSSEKTEFKEIFGNEQLKTAYTPLAPMEIDDMGFGDYTWAEAALQTWCSGSGTWSDPYIIDGISIHVGDFENALEISNSEVYFIVQNSKFTGAWSSSGIDLSSADNGQILNNDLSDNEYCGIFLIGSDNNTIQGNTIYNNQWGIEISGNKNKVLDNIATNNLAYGIQSGGDYNEITGNTMSENGMNGIYLTGATYSIVTGNTASNNDDYGIELANHADYNTITGNTLVDNGKGCINEGDDCVGNTISNNDCQEKEEEEEDEGEGEESPELIAGYDFLLIIGIISFVCALLIKKQSRFTFKQT